METGVLLPYWTNAGQDSATLDLLPPERKEEEEHGEEQRGHIKGAPFSYERYHSPKSKVVQIVTKVLS